MRSGASLCSCWLSRRCLRQDKSARILNHRRLRTSICARYIQMLVKRCRLILEHIPGLENPSYGSSFSRHVKCSELQQNAVHAQAKNKVPLAKCLAEQLVRPKISKIKIHWCSRQTSGSPLLRIASGCLNQKQTSLSKLMYLVWQYPQGAAAH